jgi:hypothetical protein
VDPAADLRRATERNAREAQEEAVVRAEADALAAASAQAKARATEAARAQAEAAAKEQAEADAKATEDPADGGIPEATFPEQLEPPVAKNSAPIGAAGAGQAAPERMVADAAALEAEATRRGPGVGEQGNDRPGGPEVPPASARMETSQALVTRVPSRLRQARASS